MFGVISKYDFPFSLHKKRSATKVIIDTGTIKYVLISVREATVKNQNLIRKIINRFPESLIAYKDFSLIDSKNLCETFKQQLLINEFCNIVSSLSHKLSVGIIGPNFDDFDVIYNTVPYAKNVLIYDSNKIIDNLEYDKLIGECGYFPEPTATINNLSKCDIVFNFHKNLNFHHHFLFGNGGYTAHPSGVPEFESLFEIIPPDIEVFEFLAMVNQVYPKLKLSKARLKNFCKNSGVCSVNSINEAFYA